MKRQIVYEPKVRSWYVNKNGELVKIIKSYPIYIHNMINFKHTETLASIYIDNNFEKYYCLYNFSRKKQKYLNKLYELNDEDKLKAKPKNTNKIIRRKHIEDGKTKLNKWYIICKTLWDYKGNFISLKPLRLFREKYTYLNLTHGTDTYELSAEDKKKYWPLMLANSESGFVSLEK